MYILKSFYLLIFLVFGIQLFEIVISILSVLLLLCLFLFCYFCYFRVTDCLKIFAEETVLKKCLKINWAFLGVKENLNIFKT